MQYKEGLVALNNGSTVYDFTLQAVENGSLSNGTYYYVISVIYPAGESIKSTEKSISLSGNYKGVVLSWQSISGASKYRIYRGTASNGQNVYYETTETQFTDTGASGTTGTPKTSSDVAQYVVGYGTKFLSNVTVGCIFKRKDENVSYQVASVINDTLLKLNASYAGEGSLGAEYQIVRDFTENLGLTEIWSGDVDWAYHLTMGVIRKLDQILWTYSGFQIKAIAYEDLPKNSLINIYTSNNTLYARKAHAPSQYIALGFVDNDYIEGQEATIILFGAIKNLSNLSVGNYHFLGDYGTISPTASATGVVQVVGFAISSDTLIFNPQVAIYIEEG